MNPREGDIVRYIYLDTHGEEIYGLVIKSETDWSRLLLLWGQANVGGNLFRNVNLRVVK